MRVDEQVTSFNVFKEVDSPSSVDDCYRVNLVKESIKDNALKEASLVCHEASTIHPVDKEAKKVLGNTDMMEAPQHSYESNPLKEVIEPSLSSSNHHKAYKKDMRKWRT
ncbi:hypothetical protein PanWU01x14_233300 [Parasponia andersonii]|uniref:Uncharacterized protein n=1 Tax=Parasponia andersonii TaxID=3476 RepID=A0A2P5BJG3_PARAD|nr:hypothetical protein PanWU01x14_233300 [Parasponia andersonii]